MKPEEAAYQIYLRFVKMYMFSDSIYAACYPSFTEFIEDDHKILSSGNISRRCEEAVKKIVENKYRDILFIAKVTRDGKIVLKVRMYLDGKLADAFKISDLSISDVAKIISCLTTKISIVKAAKAIMKILERRQAEFTLRDILKISEESSRND